MTGFKVNGVDIYPVQSNIAEEPVDAIINPTDEAFNATGKVFKALIERGGQEIKTACNKAKMTDGVFISRFAIITLSNHQNIIK